MKKTKKRALLSSVAMLVVSAIVLSSATFAWFMAGDTATIKGISATVTPTSGLVLSPNNTTTWKAGLIKSDFAPSATTNWFPGNLEPVSTAAGMAMSFYSGSFQTNTNDVKTVSSVDSDTDLGLKIVKFTFWIKSDETKTVTLSESTIDGLASDATYVAIKVGTDQSNAGTQAPYLFSKAADAYYPITSAGQATDTDGDAILSPTEAPAMVSSSPVSSSTMLGNAVDFELSAGVAKQIIVYMWLEGNDSNCKLGGVSGDAQLDLSFKAA